MVKRVLPFLFFAILLGVLLNGCSPTFCSTPYILSGGDCCLDKNNDGTCDQQQTLAPEEKQSFAQPLTGNIVKQVEQPVGEQEKLLTTDEGVLLTIDPDDDPSQGNPDADVLFIEFGDYTNEASQRFHKEILPKILETYGTKINYVFRNFPEVNNDNAQLAAEASECAHEQGKFWEYHDYLFTQSQHLTLSSLRIFASTLGLDMDSFEACFFSHRYKDEVLKDRADGLGYGVSHIPTFFINNQKIVGFKLYDTFDAVFRDLFYKEIAAAEGVTVSAQSTGLAYAILPGPAALEPTVTQSPYSNRLELVDGVFSVSARDITPRDSGVSKDTASLVVTYSQKQGGLTGKNIYTLQLTKLLTEGVSYSYFGGVGTEVNIYGNTGIGTRYLPRAHVPLVLWGLADLKENGETIIEDALVQFTITPGMRDTKNQLLSKVDDTDIEAYLLVSARGNQKLPFEGGFLYLFWPNVNLRQS